MVDNCRQKISTFEPFAILLKRGCRWLKAGRITMI